jgi:acyloxyacyl hydrolase
MRQRNRCNHRQYQNIGFNGGRMNDLRGQLRGLSISKDSKPFIAFVSYIGNDVCKRELEQMTKPEDYQRQLIEGLADLDKAAPKGSKVIVTGLVDGRILFREMGHRKHPLGVTYKNVYDFLDCTDANPVLTLFFNLKV